MGNPFPKYKRKSHDRLRVSRRETVAILKNRMMTVREIQTEMAHPDSKFYFENPGTGKGYSVGTIQGDLTILEKQALENAQKQTEEYRARQLAEIQEARRVAWEDLDLKMIAKFIELEMKLTGTDRSITLNQFNQQNNYLLNEDGEPKTVDDMTDKELMLIASKAIGDDEIVEAELVEEED